MIFKSVVGKLWIAIVLLFILVLTVLGIFLSQSFDKVYMDLQMKSLTEKALHVSQILQEEKDDKLAMEKIQLLLDDAHARIINPQGLIEKCSPGMPMNPGMRLDEQDVLNLQKGQIVSHWGENHMGVNMLSVTVPIKKDSKVELAVQVLSPLKPITETTNKVRMLIIGTAVGAIVLATFLSFFLLKKLSGPLLEMNKVASQMREKNFDGKVNITSDDELGRLGKTLNILSTELQESLGALSNEKDQLSNILASMTDGVITFNHTGQIIMMNPKAAKLFQVEDKQPIGDNVDDCCPIPDIKEMYKIVLFSGLAEVRQITWLEQVLSVRMAPLKDEVGQLRGVVSVVGDITKESKLEKMRKDFVANVSHELRNPLFLLQGYGEALLHDVADEKEERDEIIKIIVDETLRLQRLVNDILDLANLESDKFVLRKEKILFRDIITGVLKRYQPLAIEKNINLNYDIQKDMPFVLIDPDRITQVLINLLDNAFRFTGDNGEIQIKAELDDGILSVDVKDSGQGIPDKELPYIWERFYKVEKSRNRKVGGTGLGLAIVRKIIENHGGRVIINSTFGKGTNVTFFIPLGDSKTGL